MPSIAEIDIVFKEEYTKLVAIYSNQYGVSNIELIEDAVQDAFYKALKLWPIEVPEKPKAWIRTVSKNSLIDKLRAKKADFLEDVGGTEDLVDTTESTGSELEIKDNKLKMIFACCHPEIKVSDQLLLSLKYLCGFGNRQIARALLKSHSAIEKAVTRARTKFQAAVSDLDIPPIEELQARLEGVVKVIYLQFNEGYKLSEGQELVNKSLCLDAIKLAELIASYSQLAQPKLNALLALMYFQSSRLDSRIDPDGNLLTLEFQDRRRWNHRYILQGDIYLSRAAQGEDVSLYHIEAAIASYHCTALSYAETNWAAIEDLYNFALAKAANPNYELNRLIARSYRLNANEALEQALELRDKLPEHQYTQVFFGDLYEKSGEVDKAGEAYHLALKMTSNELEKGFVKQKIEGLGMRPKPTFQTGI